jgi:hypothetical protein
MAERKTGPIVFVIAEPSIPKVKTGRVIDLAPLQEYSTDVRFLVMRGQFPTFQEDGLYTQIKNSLEGNFFPMRDYIVWAGGDALAAVMSGMAIGSLGIERFRWLRHERSKLPDGTRDASRGRYVPIWINTGICT